MLLKRENLMTKLQNTSANKWEEAIRTLRNSLDVYTESDSWYGCRKDGIRYCGDCDGECKQQCEFILGDSDRGFLQNLSEDKRKLFLEIIEMSADEAEEIIQ